MLWIPLSHDISLLHINPSQLLKLLQMYNCWKVYFVRLSYYFPTTSPLFDVMPSFGSPKMSSSSARWIVWPTIQIEFLGMYKVFFRINSERDNSIKSCDFFLQYILYDKKCSQWFSSGHKIPKSGQRSLGQNGPSLSIGTKRVGRAPTFTQPWEKVVWTTSCGETFPRDINHKILQQIGRGRTQNFLRDSTL